MKEKQEKQKPERQKEKSETGYTETMSSRTREAGGLRVVNRGCRKSHQESRSARSG